MYKLLLNRDFGLLYPFVVDSPPSIALAQTMECLVQSLTKSSLYCSTITTTILSSTKPVSLYNPPKLNSSLHCHRPLFLGFSTALSPPFRLTSTGAWFKLIPFLFPSNWVEFSQQFRGFLFNSSGIWWVSYAVYFCSFKLRTPLRVLYHICRI